MFSNPHTNRMRLRSINPRPRIPVPRSHVTVGSACSVYILSQYLSAVINPIRQGTLRAREDDWRKGAPFE